jgi:hypothetical protein
MWKLSTRLDVEERPTLIGFEGVVGRVTSSFEVIVYFEYSNPGWEV